MKSRSIFISSILLSLIHSSFAQHNINSFNKIQISVYRTISDSDRISDYIEIDKAGVLKSKVHYYSGVGDKYFILTLNDTVIDFLNSIFNGKTRLKTYIVQKSLPKDAIYGGEYYFIFYTSTSGISDSVTFIPYQVSDNFWASFGKLEDLLECEKKEINVPVLPDPKFLAAMKQSRINSPNLPETKEIIIN